MSLLLKNNKQNLEFDKKDADFKKWLMKNGDNINVELINLTVGTVVFIEPRTKEVIIWKGSADTKIVSVSTLLAIKTTGKNLLENFVLGIGEIFSNTKRNVTVEELLGSLGLKGLYEPFGYDVSNMDGIIINSTLDEFSNICSRLPLGVIERIAERFCYLRKEKYVDSRNKENIITDIIGKVQLFRMEENDE